VPTVAQSGYKDYEVEVWFGLVAPANTPKKTVSELAGWFTAALRVPEVKAKLATLGLYPVGMCGADFGAFLRKHMTNSAAPFASRTSRRSDLVRDPNDRFES